MKNLVPIGRFSQICRLSLKALRLYDELGLLRPALVDPDSGYRYYSLSQALEAERIRVLRSIEVPLDEIGQVLHATAPGAAREILQRHRGRLAARVEQYRAMLANVERLASEEHAPYAVRTKELVPQQVLSIRLRTRLASLGMDAPRAFGEMIAHLGRAQAHPAGPLFALYHGPEFDEEDLDVESRRWRTRSTPARTTRSDPSPMSPSSAGCRSTATRATARRERSISSVPARRRIPPRTGPSCSGRSAEPRLSTSTRTDARLAAARVAGGRRAAPLTLPQGKTGPWCARRPR